MYTGVPRLSSSLYRVQHTEPVLSLCLLFCGSLCVLACIFVYACVLLVVFLRISCCASAFILSYAGLYFCQRLLSCILFFVTFYLVLSLDICVFMEPSSTPSTSSSPSFSCFSNLLIAHLIKLFLSPFCYIVFSFAVTNIFGILHDNF